MSAISAHSTYAPGPKPGNLSTLWAARWVMSTITGLLWKGLSDFLSVLEASILSHLLSWLPTCLFCYLSSLLGASALSLESGLGLGCGE